MGHFWSKISKSFYVLFDKKRVGPKFLSKIQIIFVVLLHKKIFDRNVDVHCTTKCVLKAFISRHKFPFDLISVIASMLYFLAFINTIQITFKIVNLI